MEALRLAQLAEQSAAGDNIRVVVRVRPPNERELAQVRAAQPHAAPRALHQRCQSRWLTRGCSAFALACAQGYVKECVTAQPATGAIAVAGKAFAFDAVCDDTMGQARPARRAPACWKGRAVQQSSAELRRAAQRSIAAAKRAVRPH